MAPPRFKRSDSRTKRRSTPTSTAPWPIIEAASLREMGRNQLGNVRVELQDEPLSLLARAFPLGAGRDGFGLGFQVTGEHDDDDERLPFYDQEAIDTLVGLEALLYEGLATR